MFQAARDLMTFVEVTRTLKYMKYRSYSSTVYTFYVTFYGNAVEMCFVMFLIWIILPISSDATHIKN